MTQFKTRLLYTQKSMINHEQGQNNISSSIYALKFFHPGASQPTSGRIRITCVYTERHEGFEAHSGVIERWTDKGWIILEDYTDNLFQFLNESEFRKRMIDYAHSFIMGIPLDLIDAGYTPVPKEPNDPKGFNKKPFKVYDFKNKKFSKSKKEDNYNKESEKSNDEKPDDDSEDNLDWL